MTRLKAPTRGYSDEFYEDVAAAYRAHPGRPVTAIAAEANVPHTTAARWVREARRRGQLGTAPTRGKAGERIGARHD